MSALTKALASMRQSRMHGRPSATCPSIRPTSIPLRWPSANSKHFCARPPSEPFRVFGERFARSCHASVLKNVPITSGMRDMLQYDRETLLGGLTEPQLFQVVEMVAIILLIPLASLPVLISV